MHLVARTSRPMAMAIGILSFVISTISGVHGQDNVVRIEEDWELHVSQPDEQIDAPQVTTTLLPFGENSDVLLQVDWNHASAPSFSTGGYQLRACYDDECDDESRHLANMRLEVADETISWTQVVQKVGSGYVFGVNDGKSDSWGEFGGNHTFIRFNAEHFDDSLSSYDPQASAVNSGVTYASNRVGWLRLKKIRIYTSSGQMAETAVNLDAQ